MSELEQAIEQADEAMYKRKQIYKAQAKQVEERRRRKIDEQNILT